MAKSLNKNGAIIRSRNWFLVSYLSLEAITEYCKMGHISRYAFIKHDKDEGKEPHFHLLVVYKNPRTWSAVHNDFLGRAQNTMVEQCLELDASFDYLTHKRNPEKAQYDIADVVCDDLSYWQALACGEETNKATELIADILDGKNPVFMLKKYGRDFVLNAQKYYEFAYNLGTLDEKLYDEWQRVNDAKAEEAKRLAFEEINGRENAPAIYSFDCFNPDGSLAELCLWND